MEMMSFTVHGDDLKDLSKTKHLSLRIGCTPFAKSHLLTVHGDDLEDLSKTKRLSLRIGCTLISLNPPTAETSPASEPKNSGHGHVDGGEYEHWGLYVQRECGCCALFLSPSRQNTPRVCRACVHR